jgi:hypothetical protein
MTAFSADRDSLIVDPAAFERKFTLPEDRRR